MNLFHILFGKSIYSKKTRKARYTGSKQSKSYKKGEYRFKYNKSRRNKHRMKGG